MEKRRRVISLIVFGTVILGLIVGICLAPPGDQSESIQEVMQDAVLHESAKISLFGLLDVNPGLIAAYCVTALLLVLALLIRIFAIPRFTLIPGKLQILLETAVGYFDGLAQQNTPHSVGFVNVYLFGAGVYIFASTLFELLGVQAVTTAGHPVSLPAPLSDINGAIAMGVTSYLVILGGGLVKNKVRGVANTLKEFSLPISMSFRLFGALLSGALVTELVYYYTATSVVIPVIVAVMFTALHALIQAYVLTMLVSVFYGEVTEPHVKKPKQPKQSGRKRRAKA
ncbi:MAG: F0F1 ATP synthase subunit A [Clostridia bacterium]|nr:F0F1 ATP synthase subunit A [Clostridia bacterium]